MIRAMSRDTAQAEAIISSIHFLKRSPVFLEEKPYAFRFDREDDSIPQTNMTMEEVEGIAIANMRGAEDAFTLEKNGFEVMELQSKLAYEDFDDKTKIPVYLRELEELLQRRLGANQVLVFRHGLRKRHPEFPVSTGRRYQFDQPTSVAHVDTTPEDMIAELERQPALRGGRQSAARIEWINVWKPLRGPLNDWPLALCDSSTVDSGQDFETADILYPELVVENYQVHYSERHRWYYLSDHRPDELIVFRQASNQQHVLPGTSCACICG
jgi:hypothetical protein